MSRNSIIPSSLSAANLSRSGSRGASRLFYTPRPYNTEGAASASVSASVGALSFSSAQNASASVGALSFSSAPIASASAYAIEGSQSRAQSSSRAAYRSSNNAESQIEQAILNSSRPLDINASEEVEVNGVRGVLLNKSEIDSFRGNIPISEYRINQDSDPVVIRRRLGEKVKLTQEVAVRYLKPPAPSKPGDIIIKQEPDVQAPAAPPLVIRQQSIRPNTPQPLVIREAPPQPPKEIPSKVITVPGKVIPPPPRKVVIEKLPEIPAKPQNVIIEKWLPYEEPAARRVVYEKPCSQPRPACPPRNVIVEWEKPEVEIETRHKCLGVVEANPCEYINKYKSDLKNSGEYDHLLQSFKGDCGEKKSSCGARSAPRLEGDVEALRLVDLDREGLSEYKSIVGQYSSRPSSRARGGCPRSSCNPTPVVVQKPSCGCN